MTQSTARRPLTKRRIQQEIVPLIEFAWAAGLLLWDAEQYAKALLTIFPAEFDQDPIIELSKHAFRMNEKRNLIMQSGGATETPGVKKARRRVR